jgi:hypothetical protein
MSDKDQALMAARDALIGHGAECKDVNDALALIDAALGVHALCDECETVAHCLKNGCVPKQPSKDEALKLVLEALERYQVKRQDFDRFTDEITAIKQALNDATHLAAPVQSAERGEPVVNASAWFALVMNAAAELEDASHCLRDEDAKRVAISGAKHYRDAAKALYTTPPAQQRKPLTDEEIELIFRESSGYGGDDFQSFARAIEAKLKEKNSG